MATNLTLLAPPERNRYFYGLLMDAERFQRDQDYFNQKRLLLNRLVTGAGVVSGLALTWSAATSTLTLSAGVAIDLAGREIIVPAATTIDVTQLTDAQGKTTGPVPAGATILIAVAYAEQKVDAVPVLVLDCDHPGACAPSTIEEGFEIVVTVAAGPPPPLSGCVLGSFPLPPGTALQTAIANQIASGYSPVPASTSITLGRLNLSSGVLDPVSDRPVVYDNTLLYQLIVCLAAQVSQLGSALTYVSGDNQSAKAGTALANPLVVSLVDAGGNPVTTGSPPTFTVTSGGGSVGAVTTPGPGQYETTWTLGAAGAQTVTAQTTQSSLTVTFQAAIEP
jgi:hypothetical protein